MIFSAKTSLLLALVAVACSPLRTSPHDEKHQLELTMHEVQTNLDDLRHDINCFQTELQIVEGRIKYFENALASLKQQDIEKQQAKIDQISHQLQGLEKKWSSWEKMRSGGKEELDQLSQHASETNASLTQFKDRIEELEKEILGQNRRLEALSKVKGNLESLAKSLKGVGGKTYTVRSGDTLDKIAKENHTSIEKIKKLNNLDQDLIVVDQELKIPVE